MPLRPALPLAQDEEGLRVAFEKELMQMGVVSTGVSDLDRRAYIFVLPENWEPACPYSFLDEFDQWIAWQKRLHTRGMIVFADVETV